MPSASGDRSTLRLIESLLWDGGLHRVGRHLRRLASSARRLGHRLDVGEARERLSAAVADLEEGAPPHKVRLSLAPDGRLEVERSAVGPVPEPVPTLLTDVRVDPSDELLYHKTSRRRAYDDARLRASGAGCREGLLLNVRGEVTEGSFTNVFVQVGDAWHTPPVGCGLLPGVYREVILETRDGAEERVLRPEDLSSADAVWLCNSVRGLLRARLVTPDAG